MAFWSIVGQASFQTAREIGPSTIERSKLRGDGGMGVESRRSSVVRDPKAAPGLQKAAFVLSTVD
jgi:hypothetical protein